MLHSMVHTTMSLLSMAKLTIPCLPLLQFEDLDAMVPNIRHYTGYTTSLNKIFQDRIQNDTQK
jgi:hypothetical protein